MTGPLCDICEEPLAREDVDWRVACLACGGSHFYCVPCAVLWGNGTLGDADRNLDAGIWTEVVLCPDEARATALLMGLDLPRLSKDVWRSVSDKLGEHDSDRRFGSGLADLVHLADLQRFPTRVLRPAGGV